MSNTKFKHLINILKITLIIIMTVCVCLAVAACKHEHEYSSEITREATCTLEGEIVYKCSCGESYTEPVPMKNHVLSTKSDGDGHWTACSECEYVTQKTEHTYVYLVNGNKHKQHCTECLYEAPETDHQFTTLFSHTDSTCTVQGMDVYKCVCGENKTEMLPLDKHSLSYVKVLNGHYQECANCTYSTAVEAHAYTKTVSTIDSTCTTQGSVVKACECGEETTETLPLAEHSFTKTGRNDTQHWTVCANCDAIKPDTTEDHICIPTMSTEPDCVNAGVKKYECKCGYGYEETNGAALGHDLDKTAIESRTQAGHWYMCLRCNKKVAEEHDYVESECKYNRESTCYLAGHQDYTCIICNFKDERNLGRTDEHTPSAEWSNNGTEHWHTCVNGNGEVTCDAKLDKAFHLFVEVIENPTCTQIGHRYMRCECGYTQSNTNIPALQHNYQVTEVIKEATCQEQGEEIRTCEICGDVQTFYTDKLDHDWSLYEADVNAHYRKCSMCLSVQTTARGHSYTDVITSNATCTENGSMTRTCNVCKFSYEAEIIARGHNYVTDEGAYDDPDKHLDATCTEAGWVMKTCSQCGRHEQIPVPPHGIHEVEYHKPKEPTETERGNIGYHQCTVCGKYFSSKDCHEEYTEDQVFYSLPKVIPVSNFEELLTIAETMESDTTSFDYYQVNVVVYAIKNDKIEIWDNESELTFIFTVPSNIDASVIGIGVELVVKGNLYVYKYDSEIAIDLENVEIVSVAQQAGAYTLFVESNLGISEGYVDIKYDDENYYDVNVKYFNTLKPAKLDTLTITYSKYNPAIKLLKVLVNGKAVTAKNGTLTLTVTGDVHVQFIFDNSTYSDLPTTSVSIDKFDTVNGNSHDIDEYVSYDYIGQTNTQGRIEQNSHLRFYVYNANIVEIIITYADYNAGDISQEKTVLRNTLYVGIDNEHKSVKEQTALNANNKMTISFDASEGYQYIDYFTSNCQARIVEITIRYATNNTF